MNQSNYIATRKATLIGAGANTLLAVSKILLGWLGNSAALVADGIHSASDLLTDLLVILAAKFAAQGADEDHQYGHARIETIASVGLALLLVSVGIAIIFDAIMRIMHHQHILLPSNYVIWVAAASVVINEAVYRYTKHVANQIKSEILLANAVHSRTDAASSLVVLVGVVGTTLGVTWLDSATAILVGLLVIKMGVAISWRNVAELIDTAVEPEQLQHIQQLIVNVPGVEALHQLRTRKMAGKIVLDVHIIVNGKLSVSEGHHIGDHVLVTLYKNVDNLLDVTIHVDPEDDDKVVSKTLLPHRGKLQGLLRNKWHQLPQYDSIIEIKLHYLQEKIEIELLMPLSVLSHNDADQLQQQYRHAVAAYDYIHAIDIHYKC